MVGQRPLKYETTKPISALHNKTQARSRRDVGSKLCLDLESTSHLELGSRSRSLKEETNEEFRENGLGEKQRTMTPEADDPSGEEKCIQNRRCLDSFRVRVAQFDIELKDMESLENNFRYKALQLQKKLGLEERGMIS